MCLDHDRSFTSAKTCLLTSFALKRGSQKLYFLRFSLVTPSLSLIPSQTYYLLARRVLCCNLASFSDLLQSSVDEQRQDYHHH